MLKKLSLLIILLINFNKLNAQCDTIVYLNGTRQAAKIIEISIEYVKFKNPLDTLGATLSVPTNQIQRFVLKKGYIETPSYTNIKTNTKDSLKAGLKTPLDDEKADEFKRTIIGVDIGQAFIEHLQFNVEYIFKSRKFGIAGYYNQGLLDGFDTSVYGRLEAKVNNGAFYKKSYGGFDFKYYPIIHTIKAVWIALGAEGGKVVEKITYDHTSQTSMNGWQYLTNTNGGYTFYPNTTYISYYTGSSTISLVNRFFMSYHFSCGFLYRIKKHLVCEGNLSVGLNQFNGVEGNKYGIKASAGLLLGYAF